MTLDTRTTADRADHGWLTNHAPQAQRLLAVDHEPRARDEAVTHADRTLDALDHQPLDRLPLHHDLDLDLDMGR